MVVSFGILYIVNLRRVPHMTHLRSATAGRKYLILNISYPLPNISLRHLNHLAHIHKQLSDAQSLEKRDRAGRLPYLPVPNWISGVTDDSRPSLLPMVGTSGETALLPWLNGHLKVRVRIEEHPFL